MNRLLLALIAISGVGSTISAQAQVHDYTSACVNREDQSSLCLNDHVMDDEDKKGKIIEIYNDNSGVVQFSNGQTNRVNLQFVSREVNCLYGFCAGDEVNHKSGQTGHITDLYENGVAEVDFDNDEDGLPDFVEINDLTSLEGASQNESIQFNYAWGAPRPFPDVTYYHYRFYPAPVQAIYYYPVNYRHPHAVFGGVIFSIFPPRPVFVGYRHFEAYPYHTYRSGYVVQWGFHPRVRAPSFNQHFDYRNRGVIITGGRPGFDRGYHGGFNQGRPGNRPVIIAPRPIPGPRGGFGGGDFHGGHEEHGGGHGDHGGHHH